MEDKQKYENDSAGFFYNTDIECREKYDLELNKDYIIFFNGPMVPPKKLEWNSDDNVSYLKLLKTLNISIA